MEYSPERWSGLSNSYSRLTQRTGGKKSVVTAVITDFYNNREENRWEPNGKRLGNRFVRVNDNKGRKREGRYLRIPPFSSSLFLASFVERTSGEGVFFRVASSWIAGILQFQVTSRWIAGTLPFRVTDSWLAGTP